MTVWRLFIVSLGEMGLLLFASQARALAPIEGLWATQHDKAVVKIYDCDGAACGTIVRPGRSDKPWPMTDVRNTNPALRTRPLIGLQIIGNLKPMKDHWKGVIYSPEDGRSYEAMFTRVENGALAVKGCWMFLCRSQIWQPIKG